MASSKDYLTYVLELLREVRGISYKKMMGEFMLYKDGNEVLPHVLRLDNTEIDDACRKAIELMNMEFCPDIAVI